MAAATAAPGGYTVTPAAMDSVRMNRRKMQAAANYIASRHYVEALNALNGIPFGERRARWYYFSAIANQGMGNNINAMEHAKRAVEMEPSNMEYRQFLQHLQYGGTWYTSMGSDYDRPYASAGTGA